MQNPSSEHQNPCLEHQNSCSEVQAIHSKQEICCSDLQTIGLKQRNPYLQQGLTCLEQRIWYPELMTQTIYFLFRGCALECY